MTSSLSERDYPYEANQDYVPSLQQNPYGLSISRGDKGKVLGDASPAGWVLVSCGAAARGYVPRWAINVGTTRKFGDRVFNHDMPLYPTLNFDPSLLIGNSSFDRAVWGLALALKTNQGLLPFLPARVRDVINNDAVRNGYVAHYLSCIVPAYLQIANNPNCNVSDFWNTIKAVDINEQRIGFYARITKNFRDPGKRDQKPQFYIGWTGAGFFNRLKSHRNADYDDQSYAARSVRETQNCDTYPICIIANVAEEYQQLCEQLTILLHGSYVSHLKAAPAPFANTASTQQFVKNYDRRERAQTLTRIANTVFNLVGFIPLCERQSFGISATLNYDSPIATSTGFAEKAVWVKTVHQGVKEVYHRGSRKLRSAGNVGTSVSIKEGRTYDGLDFAFIAYLGSSADLAVGIDVYAVVEIMLNEAHHTPWARLSDVGIWSDWKIANRLGVRIEWQKDGKWFYRYVQRGEQSFMPTSDQGALRAYTEAMGMIKHLRQVGQEQPRGWDIDFGIARIKQLTYDHLNQTFTLQEIAPTGQNLKRVTLKSASDLEGEIRALGAQDVNGIFKGLGGVAPPTDGRPCCDHCFIRNNYIGDALKSGPISNTGCTVRRENNIATRTCLECYYRGTICSWTPRRNFTREMIVGFGSKVLAPTEDIPLALEVKKLDLN